MSDAEASTAVELGGGGRGAKVLGAEGRWAAGLAAAGLASPSLNS